MFIMVRKNNGLQFVWKAFLVVGLAAYLVFLFKDVNVADLISKLSVVGFLFVPIIALYGIGCLFDTMAWRRLLPQDRTVPFLKLLQIHVAGESFYRFIPAGAIVGESVKIFLLNKHTGVKTHESVSSLFLRKLLMGLAQALYIGGAVIIGIVAGAKGLRGTLEITGAIMAALLLLIFIIFGVMLSRGNFCQRLLAILRLVPLKRLRSFLSQHEEQFRSADVQLNMFLTTRRREGTAAFFLFFGGWLTELAETIVILAALHTSISVHQAMLFEPVVSLLRSIAFVLPAGLGVMDAGYVSSFTLFGVTEAVTVAASFIVIKRLKEIVWITIGIVLTVMLGADFKGMLSGLRNHTLVMES